MILYVLVRRETSTDPRDAGHYVDKNVGYRYAMEDLNALSEKLTALAAAVGEEFAALREEQALAHNDFSSLSEEPRKTWMERLRTIRIGVAMSRMTEIQELERWDPEFKLDMTDWWRITYMVRTMDLGMELRTSAVRVAAGSPAA